MTGQKHDPAFILPGESQQGIGKLLLAQGLYVFAAIKVADDDFAATGNAEFTHPCRLQVRIDELQGNVILEALVTADQTRDLVTRHVIVADKGTDADRVLHGIQQPAGVVRDGIACPGRPVCLVDILRT